MYEEESNYAIQKITPIGDVHSKDFQGSSSHTSLNFWEDQMKILYKDLGNESDWSWRWEWKS